MISVILPLIFACGPKEVKETSTSAATRIHSTMPKPLAPRPFNMPTLQEGKLSNGIPVALSFNDEAPLVNIWITFDEGGFTDPDNAIGLASMTMDMLDEGAANKNAAELSKSLKALASSLGTGASTDGAYLSLKALSHQVEPTLAIAKNILLSPNFPKDKWELQQKKALQNLAANKKNPRRTASRVMNSLMFGSDYMGRTRTEEGLKAIDTDQMKRWHETHIQPQKAKIWVSGNADLKTLIPQLDAAFGTWSVKEPAKKYEAGKGNDKASPKGTVIYLVDNPGASQSVIRIGQYIGRRQDAETLHLSLANQAIGGMFTARINMNLREDKGWTYGARSWQSYSHHPGMWNASTNIVTKHTADGLREIISEVRNSMGEKPITEQEFSDSKGAMLNKWPLQFENASNLLSQNIDRLRYSLPDDWIASYPDRVRSVTLVQAQDAWNNTIDPEKMTIVIVGDKASISAGLNELGYSIIDVDEMGRPIE